jgi:hypothetical protein
MINTCQTDADVGASDWQNLRRAAGYRVASVSQAMLDVGAAYSRWWAQSGPKSPTPTIVRDGSEAG